MVDKPDRIHCLNLQNYTITNRLLLNKTSECLTCFFYQNCISNNTCLNGTTGETCEVCDQNYYLFGNSCKECEMIPWSAVCFGVFLVFVIFVTMLQGFTPSLCTKLKILTHFFQLLILSVHIKIVWPPVLFGFVASLGFGKFTLSIARLKCFVPFSRMNLHFLEWATAIALPSIIIVLCLFCIKSLKRSLSKLANRRKNDALEKQKINKILKLRRFMFLAIITYFMPVALTVIQSFSCYSTFGEGMVLMVDKRDRFLYDNSEKCDTILFQSINLLLSFYLLVYIILLPLILTFFTLRQKKWNLLEREEFVHGYMYDSYTHRFCFWEALPMLRKLFGILVTDTILTNPFFQSIGHLSMTGIYLFFLILFRPYRKFYWYSRSINIHVLLDVVTNIGLAFVQMVALLVVLDLYPHESLDYFISIYIIICLIFSLICLLCGSYEKQSQIVIDISITRGVQSPIQEAEEGKKSTNPASTSTREKSPTGDQSRNNKSISRNPENKPPSIQMKPLLNSVVEEELQNKIKINKGEKKESLGKKVPGSTSSSAQNPELNSPPKMNPGKIQAHDQLEKKARTGTNSLKTDPDKGRIHLTQTVVRKPVVTKKNKIGLAPDAFDW